MGLYAVSDAYRIGDSALTLVGRRRLPAAAPPPASRSWDGSASITRVDPAADVQRSRPAHLRAQFANVGVGRDLGLVPVRRLVGVFAPGRVLNQRTANSQPVGGMLWGMSRALLEATLMDPQDGRWANTSMSEYLVPAKADTPDVVVDTIEVLHDEVVNPVGVKGVGEIGVVGTAAAIANAVFHATGRQTRTLPIRIEDLLCPRPGRESDFDRR